jgi:hypothetical protein
MVDSTCWERGGDIECDQDIAGLDSDGQDTLMKYLYKRMEQPGLYNTAVLLIWHEKVFSKSGCD